MGESHSLLLLLDSRQTLSLTLLPQMAKPPPREQGLLYRPPSRRRHPTLSAFSLLQTVVRAAEGRSREEHERPPDRKRKLSSAIACHTFMASELFFGSCLVLKLQSLQSYANSACQVSSSSPEVLLLASEHRGHILFVLPLTV